MPVLMQLRKACKAFADQVLLDDADFALTDRMRVGLVGRNGAGKSTLCKLLLGRDDFDAGDVVTASDLRLGYLEQHDLFEPNETVLGFLMRHTGEPEWRCGEVAGRFASGSHA